MAFRDDMLELQRINEERKFEMIKTEIINRPEPIGLIYYERFGNLLFEKINKSMQGYISNKSFRYDSGFLGKKNFRYETFYPIGFSIYPLKSELYKNRINISEAKFNYQNGNDYIYIETAYLDDVKKILTYILNKSKEEQYDKILIDKHDPDRLFSMYSGVCFSEKMIDKLILELDNEWKNKRRLSLYDKNIEITCNRDVTFCICCDENGNIK